MPLSNKPDNSYESGIGRNLVRWLDSWESFPPPPGTTSIVECAMHQLPPPLDLECRIFLYDDGAFLLSAGECSGFWLSDGSKTGDFLVIYNLILKSKS